MKTKQCHHFIALIGLLIGCLLPATVGASVKVGNLYYNLNASDLTAEVTDEGEPGNFEITPYTEAVISIPASINYGDNTYRVTSIGPAAFSGCTALTSVNIPNSVTSIGESAFTDCTGLTSVDIPNSVTSISATAFYNCTSLTSVNIPNSVTSIGESAFGDCPSLAFVTIPNSVTSISRAAFHDCTSLTSIVIPNSLTSIDEYTFDGCTGLTSVYIPISVTSIGQYAFGSCTGLTSITCESETPIGLSSDVFDGVDKSNCTLYVPNRTVEAYRNADFWSEFTNIEELTLNVDGIYYNVSPSTMTASVTKKPSGYYSGDITIPETVSLDDKTYRVTEIEELAFYDCKSLTSVTIPNGVTSIGYQAFYNCTRLTSIDIPSSVTSIGRGAFSNCTGLTSVTIPNGVTSIEPETFNMCNSLASVIIPNGVTSIGSMAFCRCFDLTSVTIPNGVTSIGYEAFLYCTGLTSVTIPNSVTSISNEAFSNCTSLTSFTCQNETPVTITNSVFSGVNKSTCTLNVPTGSKSAYQSAAVWGDFANIVEYEGASPSVLATGQCGDNLTYTIYEDLSIVIAGTGAMWNYNSDNPMNSDYKYIIKSVTIEEGCTAIGTYAFFDCSGLTSVDIPSSVTTIGEEAFQHCTGLTSVDIPNSVMSIGEDAFLNCRALTTISVDAGNSIYDSRNDCNAIIETSTNKLIVGCRNTVIPNSVTSIGMNALACCTGLTSVDIPNSVTSIDDFAFQFCTGLTSVSIPNSVSSIAGTAFGNCTGLTSIYVDASNATYDSRENCNAIIETSTNTLIVGCKNTVIPSSVTSIGQSAFDGCTGLTSVDIPNGVTSIDWCAFQDCIGLTSVSIPNRVTRIGQYAFYRCTSLSSISVGMTTPLVINDNVFYDVNKSSCTLYVPTGSKLAYQSADVWKDFTNIVEYEGASSVVVATGQCGDNLTYTIYEDLSMVIAGTGPMWDYVAEDTHPNQDYYSDVKSVTIEEGCTYVGKYAFDLMGSLTDVTIPGSVIEIGTGAFSYCRQLSSLELSAGLKIIGGGAFECCGRQNSGLKSITIPSTVTSIGGAAFTSCYLNSITMESSTPLTIQANTFASTDVNSCTLYVPTGSKSAYRSAAVWSEFTNIVEFTPVVVTGQCGDNVSWSFDTNTGELTISGTGPMWDYDWTRPLMDDEYNGSITSVTVEEGVTSIGDYAFYENPNLTSITIPNSVTRIGSGAFCECTGLTSFTIPNSVTNIDNDAFLGTTWYNNQPDGLVYINNVAYKYKGTMPEGTSIAIRNGTVSISECAFSSCTGLTSVTIPNSVTIISRYAFDDCTNLTSITCESQTPVSISSNNVFHNVDKSACTLYVPAGSMTAYQSAAVWSEFTNIVEQDASVLATAQCGDNLTYTIYDDMSMVITGTGPMWDYSSDTPMNSDYKGSVTSVTIEEGCTAIGAYAFNCCYEVTSVTFPNSLTAISECAFRYCVKLISLNIPNGVIAIGDYAFDNCCNLSSITVDDGNTAYDSRDNCNAIINSELDKLILGCKNTVIPVGVTSIGERAFIGCQGLTSIDIPDGVTEIGWWAFMSCHDLTTVSIPHGVTQIGAFAFLDCNSLTSVAIPNSVTYLGGNAFTSCTGLTSVTVEWNTPMEIESNVFENVDKSACILYVPTGTKSAYQSADVWKDFTNIVEYEGASSVVLATGQCGDNLTYTIYDDMSMVITGTGPMWDYSSDTPMNSDYMGSIKSVTIEEGCTTIGSYAFSCFSGLTSVDIPSSVTSIGDFAFFDCEGLTSVDIPNSVTSIGEYAFYFCTGLTSITIPNSVTSIDRCAFQGCTGLTTVTIPSSVSSIDATSFSDLTSIYVDESNATYDSRENCNAIIETSTNTLIAGCKNTVIPNSVTSIGGNAFAGCTGLTSIDIPNSVTYIGGAAFQYCTGLTSVDIPSSVTYIGYTAFSGCTSLSSISVGMTTPISIFNDAFYDVNKSTCTLYVPAGSKTAYENALYWSEFENIVEIGEEPDTDISKYDNIVYIEGTEAVVGQRVRLSLKMNNTIAPTGFQCDIYLPDGVTPVMGKDEEGKDIYLMDISTERTTSEKTNVSDCVLQSDGSLRFMCSSTKSYTFSGYEGEVAYLMVDIDPNLEEGTYPLILKNVRISDANAVKYTVDYVKTTLQISTYTVGDANNDGDVDVADFTAIANYILSRPSVSFVEKAADVNADNEIDVADLTGVANLILYGSVSPNASHAKARNDAAAKYVSIEANDVTATKDEEFIVAVTIDGNYAYSGYQFDVTLPEGMTVKDVFGQTTASDVFMSGIIDDNTLRVLCASITGETAESTVVNLTLMADSEGTYSIDIDNAIVSVNASSCAMRNSSFLVAIENEVTGISTLFDEASSNASVYDLTGKKLKSNGNTSSLPKGIYIINGKKVSK